jgi:flagellar protein FliS
MLRSQMARQSYVAIDNNTRTEQASPHRLIELLYDELLACLRQADLAMKNGNLELKSSRLSKALSILAGLEASLDFERGGDVAQSLGNVYAGARQRVISAGSGNDPVLLQDAVTAIAEVADAWRQIRQ